MPKKSKKNSEIPTFAMDEPERRIHSSKKKNQKGSTFKPEVLSILQSAPLHAEMTCSGIVLSSDPDW